MRTMADTDRPDIREWDPRWLNRRGNHMTIITPELAAELLERNTNNRTPRPRKIEQFIRDMRNDRWDPDASDIKFARDGTLLDGQNRLMACIEAGVPFATLVRTGLDPQTQSKVDTGTARTTADALRMAQVPYAGAMASAVALRMRYMERVLNFDRKRGFEARPMVPTHDEVLEYLGQHPQMEKFAPKAEQLRNIIPAIQNSVLTAALGWFAEESEADADSFVDRLYHGEFGGPGDPIMALVAYAARVRGGTRRTGSQGAKGRTAQEANLMALIKVWNALRTGEPIKLLSVKREELLEVPL